ncbi:MAG TPA: hypothetical protein VGK03_11590 [Geothrix sp.]|jgi:hypothetical protein
MPFKRILMIAACVGTILSAQIEPQLKTATDLADVYRRSEGKPEVIAIYDFTPPSRGMFEPRDYLTTGGRIGFLSNTGQAAGGTDRQAIAIFSRSKTDLDFGAVFGLSRNAITGKAEVRMIWWPTTKTVLTDSNHGGQEVVGIPLSTNSLTGVMAEVLWPATATATDVINQTTHVRFTIYLGTNSKPRTIDLPCPSRIWSSPATIPAVDPPKGTPPDPTATTTDAATYKSQYQAFAKCTYQRESVTTPDGSAVTVDPWSLANPSYGLLTVGTGTNARDFALMGQFFYSPDYLTWIFGGTKIRWTWTDGTDYTNASNIYGYLNSFAVPSSVSPVPDSAYDDGKQGWDNGLPVMTRFQALKFSTVRVFFDAKSYRKLQWAYRFVDGAYANDSNSEELRQVSSESSSGSNTALRQLRLLTETDLKAGTSYLQANGPRDMSYMGTSPYISSSNKNFNAYDTGCPDPNSPMPLAYNLANTYRQMVNATVFDTTQTCTESFVIAFPSQGPNDSQRDSFDVAAQDAYKLFGQGATENNNNYTLGTDYTQLLPSYRKFAPSALASVAAHAPASTLGNWGAPWLVTRAGESKHIQTMVISVGVPGTYLWKGGNSGKSVPHEKLFQVAQWGDPNRSAWFSINGGTPDKSKLDGGQVFYYAGTSPRDVEAAILDAIGYIVTARAALSAPATPSTGVRSTTQAYFGTFKSRRFPLWSGNLYGIGIKDEFLWKDPTDHTKGTYERFSFYGIDGASATDASGVSKFDSVHLWSAYDIFGRYKAIDYLGGVAPVADGVIGSPILWSTRTIYTLKDGALVPLPVGTESSNALFTWMAGKIKTSTGANITEAQAKTLIRWIRGAYDAANPTNGDNSLYNRVNLMGDIINSAPLAVELSLDNASVPSVLQTPLATYKASPYSNPHARLIMVGTNTGMLHCFGEVAGSKTMADPVTGATVDAAGTPYKFVNSKATELWAYVPPEFLQALWNLYVNKDVQDADHLYMVDGDPVLYHVDKVPSVGGIPDTRVTAGEDAVVVFGNRKGARTYNAIKLSSSLSSESTISSASPAFAWKIDPLDISTLPSIGATYTDDDKKAIQAMGMSTAIPAFSSVLTGSSSAPTPQDALFLSGGYSNEQVDAQYVYWDTHNADGSAKAAASVTHLWDNGLGKLVLAVDPKTGAKLRLWNFQTSPSGMGAISEGVTPLRVFQVGLVQRLYFADVKGNLWCINANNYSGDYRLDSPLISEWITTPRPIYMSSENRTGNSVVRFSTRPDAFRLPGGFPVSNSDGYNPLTVLIAIGSGDRNNPTDRTENFSIVNPSNPTVVLQSTSTITPDLKPVVQNGLFVFADRQDSKVLTNVDTKGIPDAKLAVVDASSSWPTTYSGDELTPSNPKFFWRDNYGYTIPLKNGALNDAVSGLTHDKIMVSPLIKEGVLYYSIFNVANNSGFDCSSNAFTRTFRQCDITRPLRIDTQTNTTTGQISGLQRDQDSCTGMVFYFQSLSSQLVDAGNQIMQGGARTDSGTPFGSQKDAPSKPHLDVDPWPFSRKGFRIRSWRIVR